MKKHVKTTLLSMASVMLVSYAHAADEYYSPPVKHPVQVYFGDPHKAYPVVPGSHALLTSTRLAAGLGSAGIALENTK